MSKTQIARFAGVTAGVAMAFAFATTAGAQTMSVAQLQAQIAALMAQLQAMQGGSSSSASFTRDLTIGSKGADVTDLQSWLISKGFSIPAGATGYFGAQTRTAVAQWQASAGISPAAGYFGAKSRAAIGGMGTVTGGTTTGGTVTTGSTSGSITTPGVEGILTISAGPISNTVVYAGQTKAPVLTIRAQAQRSDIDIQRVTVNLGTSTNIYNKVFNTLYLVDNATGAVLASVPLNSTTVVQSGSNYYVTLSGFHYVVPAGTYKDLSVRGDLNNSISTTYANGTSYTFQIDANGVRGVDGAGVDQYGPGTSFSQAVTANQALVDSASAAVSISPSTPLANSIPVTDTTNGQYLQLPVMAFNVTATNDTLHLHQVKVTFTGVPTSITTATATAAYLYNGSTQIASASINSSTGVATFSNIVDGTAGATIPVNTTATFTIKADVTGVTAGSLALSASLNITSGTSASDTVIYTSNDSNASNSGSASGNTQTVLGKGPAFTLLSKSISKGSTPAQNNVSTSTLSATFNIQVQAIGADVLFGDQASTTRPMVTFGTYKGGTLTVLNDASTSSATLPSSGVTIDSTNHSFTVPQNTTVTIPVTFLVEGRTVAGALASTDNYAVGVEALKWITNGTTAQATYTSGQSSWRTDTQPLP